MKLIAYVQLLLLLADNHVCKSLHRVCKIWMVALSLATLCSFACLCDAADLVDHLE